MNSWQVLGAFGVYSVDKLIQLDVQQIAVEES